MPGEAPAASPSLPLISTEDITAATSIPVTADNDPSASTTPAPVGLVPRGSLVPLEYLRPSPVHDRPTIDVDAVFVDADGNDLFDLDIDKIEDKPWRKPGVDLADYFNYGMNEAAWRNYARKQREVRGREAPSQNPFAVSEPGPCASVQDTP